MKPTSTKRSRSEAAAATASDCPIGGGAASAITLDEAARSDPEFETPITAAPAAASAMSAPAPVAPLDLAMAAPAAVNAMAPDQHPRVAPPAPGGNRARFLAGVQPSRVSCDLSNVAVTPGLRFSFEAIITVVYPASTSPPERRYIELADAHGFTGITCWNSYANAVTPDCVGRVVKFTRLALTVHNGKKSLSMSKESTMHVELPSHVSLLAEWWHGLLAQPILNALQFHDANAGIVNVSGILGLIQVEEKLVKGQPKNLLILHLTDSSGRIEVRSWNHDDTDFKQFQEQPVLLKRVRVVLFAGQKVGEMLGGPNGTTWTSDFDSSALREYWQQ